MGVEPGDESVLRDCSEVDVLFDLCRGASLNTWQMVVVSRGDLAVGMLPNEGGRAGIVPRYDDNGKTPTPGTELFLKRPSASSDEYEPVEFLNSEGFLCFERGEYCFRLSGEHAVFKLKKLVDAGILNTNVPVEFVKSITNPRMLMLPPLDTDPAEFEALHFPPDSTPPDVNLPGTALSLADNYALGRENEGSTVSIVPPPQNENPARIKDALPPTIFTSTDPFLEALSVGAAVCIIAFALLVACNRP